MTKTRAQRRLLADLKDKRRRFLYRNRAINGRYELNLDKEDDSVSVVNSVSGYGITRYSKVTIQPEKLDNETGHWQEYPKTKYYGSAGYYKKKIDKFSARDKRALECLKKAYGFTDEI